MRTAVGIVGKGAMAAALSGRRSVSGDLPEILFSVDTTPAVMAAQARVILVEGVAEGVLAGLEDLRPHVGAVTILVSTAEGVDLRQLREAVGPGPSLFRTVPVPGGRSEDTTVIVAASDGAGGDAETVLAETLAAVGPVVLVSEDQLDAAAALARSALGLLLVALEGIEDGAVSAGLPRETAQAFTTQTLLTTAHLLQQRGGSPADLKDQVASPAGTTIAGLAVLEEQGVRGAFIRAMENAVRADAVQAGHAARRGAAPRG